MRLDIQLDTTALRAAVGRVRGPEVLRILVRALEKRGNEARAEMVKGFTSAGVGRGIFGRNDAGARKLITLSKPVAIHGPGGDDVAVTITLKGFAAMQEQGGRTRPHIIRPKRGTLLAFGVVGGAGFGGELVFTKLAHHPGAPVPRHPFAGAPIDRAVGLMVEDVRRDIASLWEGKAA